MIDADDKPIAITDTGPLISIFQADCMDLVAALFGHLHTSAACLAEAVDHGWAEAINAASAVLVGHTLTSGEAVQAEEYAARIVAYSTSSTSTPSSHRGEAEVMVLAQRPEFAEGVLLLDELAARRVASESNLNISGFAGMLLRMVSEGLLTADGVKERLERCRQQGTHYSVALLERVYRQAKDRER